MAKLEISVDTKEKTFAILKDGVKIPTDSFSLSVYTPYSYYGEDTDDDMCVSVCWSAKEDDVCVTKSLHFKGQQEVDASLAAGLIKDIVRVQERASAAQKLAKLLVPNKKTK